VRQGAQLVEQRADLGADRRVGDRPVGGAHHHVDRLAGLRREPVGEQVLRLLRVAAGGGVVDLVVAAERGRQPGGDGEGGGPAEQDPAAVAERGAR
jgi:hypothetical protein